jgi:hypothetical protein
MKTFAGLKYCLFFKYVIWQLKTLEHLHPVFIKGLGYRQKFLPEGELQFAR